MTREAWMLFIPAAPNVYSVLLYPYNTSISTSTRLELNWITFACLNHDFTVLVCSAFNIVIAIVMLIIGTGCRMATPHRAMSPAYRVQPVQQRQQRLSQWLIQQYQFSIRCLFSIITIYILRTLEYIESNIDDAIRSSKWRQYPKP